MKFVIMPDYDQMSRAAADAIVKQLTDKPDSVLGLATGSTPIGMYASLVSDVEAGKVSFADVSTFNLDEYLGLEPTHDQSYRYFMNDNLFDHVDIDKARTHVPSGIGDAMEEICEDYEAKIALAGGIDLQVLGIGNNGHIGFNEPREDFPVMTHTVDLTESTIEANSRLFDSIDEVPRQAVTMGIGTIMGARRIIVVANGKGKAGIVAQAFTGPVVPEVPASVLQLHPNVTVFLDADAASELEI